MCFQLLKMAVRSLYQMLGEKWGMCRIHFPKRKRENGEHSNLADAARKTRQLTPPREHSWLFFPVQKEMS